MGISKGNKNYEVKPEVKPEEGSEESTNYLDIWQKNPAYKDIYGTFSIVKLFSFIGIILFIASSTLLLTLDIYFSSGLAVFLVIAFIITFYDEFFLLEHGFTYLFRNLVEIHPFDNFKFYMLDNDPATLLTINKKDMITIATRIFKVEVLAGGNIKPSINQFLYSLDESKIPYCYQVIQKPIIKLEDTITRDKKKILSIKKLRTNSINSYRTHIYFSVYYAEKGILSSSKLNNLRDTIIIYSKNLKSNFSANFHHIKISLLKRRDNTGVKEEEDREDLINAVRTLIYGNPIKTVQNNEKITTLDRKTLKIILRFIFIAFVIGLVSSILRLFKVPFLYILGVDLVLVCLILFLWWRELLFFFTNLHIKRYNITQINPFSDVRFYRFKKIKDAFYIHINNILLLGIKMFTLGIATQPSFAMPDKFFRAMNNQKTPFIYTLNAAPIEKKEFVTKCTKQLNEKTIDDLEGILFYTLDGEDPRYYKNPDLEYLNWIEKRTGVWKTSITISTSSYKFTNTSTIEDLKNNMYEIENELYYNAKNMGRVFQNNFKKFSLTQLKSQLLISGFQNECFKNTIFRLSGTHLNHVYFQGKKLGEFANLINEFRKGLETRIAAEFNTPLHLENFITIGHTINTEFLEKEVPMGFTFQQLKQLLITNGTLEEREHLKMKIVSELVKAEIPSVVFDYTGDWSKLIRYFRDSRYEDSFLHFKFGQSFNVNLIYSGIKYDPNNFEYLNYFYDVFALTFKTQNNTIELLKKTLRENEKLDWGSIALDMVVKPEFDRNFYSENLLNIFQDFLDQSVFFTDKALEYENDVAPLDFIKTDKTVIIDLSNLKDLEQQTFATFVILSKFIHYIHHSQEYYKKVLFIPNIDLFFSQQYIDSSTNNINFGKIDKLLAPLIHNGFGLICSANQIHYLHPNVFNYLKNIITFQATDSRDIAVLKNKMQLQELHGTGYYSTRRNHTYQIEYLMTMRNYEVIVKRNDVFQPYPGEIEIKKMIKMLPFSDERIYEYMGGQGYNLKQSEQKLSAKLKRTVFEKDFGVYCEFIEDVKKFLDSIRIVHNIGNLSKRILQEDLLKYISPRASKRTNNMKKKKAIRNDIFQILLNHEYLVEGHPAKASGGESLRTVYKVGVYYQKALDDESQTKMNQPIEVEVEIIEGNGQYNPFKANIAIENPQAIYFDDSVYNEELAEMIGHLNYAIFEVYYYGKKQKFEKMVEEGTS
ncbi:MAG TPA: hypothetical protein ENI29_03105, partial [bacterium]|nr:hypothetical protein [bacterium]